MERQINGKMNRWKDRQLERQMYSKIDRQKKNRYQDRWIDMQIDVKLYRWKDKEMER